MDITKENQLHILNDFRSEYEKAYMQSVMRIEVNTLFLSDTKKHGINKEQVKQLKQTNEMTAKDMDTLIQAVTVIDKKIGELKASL
jgi:phosphopantetheine adenylyltransferase